MKNKKLKNDYRGEHTTVVENKVGVGKDTRIVKSRERNHGAPSLKEYAQDHKDGYAWRQRKAEQRKASVRKVRVWREPKDHHRNRRFS